VPAVPRVLERPAQLDVVQPEVAAQAEGLGRVLGVARERDVLQAVVDAHAALLRLVEQPLEARGLDLALAEPRAQRGKLCVALGQLRVALGQLRVARGHQAPGRASSAIRGTRHGRYEHHHLGCRFEKKAQAFRV
jgi:hypothetical protein